MNFGEKLKALRNEREMTQPELAEAIGIEQSYLSKLENDKSLPSNDMLLRILEVFGQTVGDLVDDLDQGSKNQLRQLPEVAEHYHHQRQMIIGNRQRWLLGSAVLAALGAALIYAGYVHLLFSDVMYQYMSHGVILEGESKEIFRHPRQFISELASQEERVRLIDAVKARTDEEYRLTREFRGYIYNLEVEGGSRTYYLQDERRIDPWQSKLIVFVGVLMAMFGLIGLFLEKKLSRPI
ncbi:MAG: helix-turn-helix domain-containing protein [Woeseia sp.]